jgi:hypothetical protein
MTGKQKLVTELRLLLSGVSARGTAHLAEAEAELVQTGVLLDEAIAKLGASFMAINDAVKSQCAIVEQLIGQGALSPERGVALAAMSAETADRMNEAVTALQFHDLTGQLIDRSVRRIVGVRHILDVFVARGTEVQEESSCEQLTELLACVGATLAARSAELDSLPWKSVDQRHMNSGEIELF